MRKKLNKFRKIKYISLVPLIVITVLSVVLILFLDLKLGSDYADQYKAQVKFENPVDFDLVKNTFSNNIDTIDKFEGTGGSTVSVIFISPLSEEQRSSLEADFKNIQGFLDINYFTIHKVRPVMSYDFFFISTSILLIAYFIALNNINRSNIKIGLLFSFILITLFEIILLHAILTVISNYIFISKVFVDISISLILLVIFVNLVVLWKLNRKLNKRQKGKDLIKEIHAFEAKNDQDFVFWYTLNLLLFIPFMTTLPETKYLIIIVYTSLVYQMYLISVVWIKLFDLYLLLLQKLPVIRNLKWSQIR